MATEIDSVVRATVDGVPKVTITLSQRAQYAADTEARDTIVFSFHAHPLGVEQVDLNRAWNQLRLMAGNIAPIAVEQCDQNAMTVTYDGDPSAAPVVSEGPRGTLSDPDNG